MEKLEANLSDFTGLEFIQDACHNAMTNKGITREEFRCIMGCINDIKRRRLLTSQPKSTFQRSRNPNEIFPERTTIPWNIPNGKNSFNKINSKDSFRWPSKPSNTQKIPKKDLPEKLNSNILQENPYKGMSRTLSSKPEDFDEFEIPDKYGIKRRKSKFCSISNSKKPDPPRRRRALDSDDWYSDSSSD